MAKRPPEPRRRRRAPLGDLAGRIFAAAIARGEATAAELAEAFGLPRRTVHRRLAAARRDGAPPPPKLSGGERRHLSRTYGRSDDPAVQQWLRDQNRRA